MTYTPNIPLTLWTRVIFVDWHGVLSRRSFWSSVEKSPAYSQTDLADRVDALFRSDSVLAWMRGETHTKAIIKDHLVPHASPAVIETLNNVVVNEMKHARIRPDLVKYLAPLRTDSLIVVATDNMDCFTSGIRQRGSLWKVFDDYISSSDTGTLKESPVGFFGGWLGEHGLDFSSATLIDDSAKNCAVFRAHGGRAILFDDSPECWNELAGLSTSL